MNRESPVERVPFPWVLSTPLSSSPAPLSEQFQLHFLRLSVNEWAKWIFHQFLCASYFLCVSKALNRVETSPKKESPKYQVQSFFTNNSSPQIINYAFETCFLTVIVPFSLLQLLLCFASTICSSPLEQRLKWLSHRVVLCVEPTSTHFWLTNSANTMEMEDENDKTRTWFFDCFSSSSYSSLLRIAVYLGCGSLCHVN